LEIEGSASGSGSGSSSSGGSGGSGGPARMIGTHFAVGSMPFSHAFSVSRGGRYILSCQHWDGSFKVSQLDSGALVQSIMHHKDIVTCVAIDPYTSGGGVGGSDVIVTGSKDTTVVVWNFWEGASVNGASLVEPRHILHGHDDEVTCVAVHSDLDLIVSGSLDGTLILHKLRTGRYVRSITPVGRSPIHWVQISKYDFVIFVGHHCFCASFSFSLSSL
jgi:WD40 repeat protein